MLDIIFSYGGEPVLINQFEWIQENYIKPFDITIGGFLWGLGKYKQGWQNPLLKINFHTTLLKTKNLYIFKKVKHFFIYSPNFHSNI